MNKVLAINLEQPMAQCCICGGWDLSRWGVPIAMSGPMAGLVVGNDYKGDWAGKPACEKCWALHELGRFVGHDPAY